MINMINEITKIKHYKNPKKNKLKIHREKKISVCSGRGFVGRNGTISLYFLLPLFYSDWDNFTVLKRSCFPFKIIFHVASEEKSHLKINVNNIT